MSSFIKKLFIFLGFFLVIDHGVAYASDLISAWVPQNSLPSNIASHQSFIKNGKIYVVGGANFLLFPFSVSADIFDNGNISEWIGNLFESPITNYWHSFINTDNYLYILGGATFPNITYLQDVQYAPISESGNIGTWKSTTPLPTNGPQGGAVLVGNSIYFVGGMNSDGIYKAEILSDGSLSQWIKVGKLPEPLWGFILKKSGNNLLVVGGEKQSGATDTVYFAPINPDGTIGIWKNLPNLPQNIRRGDGVIIGNLMMIAGGVNTSNQYLNTVYTSYLNSQGETTNWESSTSVLPRGICCFSLASKDNFVYLTGGHDGKSYFSEVYKTSVDSSVLTPTPFPTPTLILTPTPTEPTKAVTKIVFLPGFGGSWNSDALLHCKSENYSGSWSLAPYAQVIYYPTINKLRASGLTVYTFAYDWRQPVTKSVENLDKYITEISSENEKIYLAGHSLGGVIGSAYMQKPEAIEKIEKFMNIGGPIQGTPWAYGAWAGGELWNSNILYQLAGKIVLNNCDTKNDSDRITIEKTFLSIHDLLPTFDYLRNDKTNNLISVSTMINQNMYLPLIFSSNTLSKIGTLSGRGWKTLNELVVKPPNTRDIKNGDWSDGHVKDKKTILDGDETALIKSVQINGATNLTIKQQHLGLVMSSQGSDAITNFFRVSTSMPSFSSNFEEPKSAIVIIGQDVSTLATDPLGVNNLETDGIITIYNPKIGKHSLTVKPTKVNAKVSVLQILEDGSSRWNDFNLKSKNQRKIDFDFKASGADINLDK